MIFVAKIFIRVSTTPHGFRSLNYPFWGNQTILWQFWGISLISMQLFGLGPCFSRDPKRSITPGRLEVFVSSIALFRVVLLWRRTSTCRTLLKQNCLLLGAYTNPWANWRVAEPQKSRVKPCAGGCGARVESWCWGLGQGHLEPDLGEE